MAFISMVIAMFARIILMEDNLRELGEVFIPLPPLVEQKRIVVRLEELLPLCEGMKK